MQQRPRHCLEIFIYYYQMEIIFNMELIELYLGINFRLTFICRVVSSQEVNRVVATNLSVMEIESYKNIIIYRANFQFRNSAVHKC